MNKYYIHKRVSMAFKNEEEYQEILKLTSRERTAILLEAIKGKTPLDLSRALVRALDLVRES